MGSLKRIMGCMWVNSAESKNKTSSQVIKSHLKMACSEWLEVGEVINVLVYRVIDAVLIFHF